jgi:hypothetical protein
MKEKNRLICAITLVVMLLSAFSATLPVSASGIPENVGGMVFEKNCSYQLEEAFANSPEVFEAEVYFPSNTASSVRGGVILGNFGRLNASVSFEVHTNGVPRLYVSDSNGKVVVDAKFTGVNLYTGQWTHLAIVRDTAKQKVYCYINGVLKQTLSSSHTADIEVSSPLLLGGDYRPKNEVYFRGAIRSVAVYGETRSATQINTDYQNAKNAHYNAQADGTELAIFNLRERAAANIVPDLGKEGNDLRKNLIWFSDKEAVSNYAYTFAVVGDTQIVCEQSPSNFHKIYDYILDNQKSKNIQFVFGLGDITNNSTSAEWNTATQNIFRLDGKIPYSVVRGNHDATSQFRKYLPLSHYADSGIVSYDGTTMLNTYQMLKVGNIDYLIFALDFGAADAILEWASGIIAEHPYHNVIITTHAYLYRDGTTLDQSEVCPPATNGGKNNGDHMWDKLVKKHENIVMVISGHDPCDNIVVTHTEGEKGNTVAQLLIDPQGVDANQGSTGLVALLHFSADGKKVQVEYYSTIKEQYFLTENQFTFEVNVVTSPNQAPDVDTETETEDTPTQQPDSSNPPVGGNAENPQTKPNKGGCKGSLPIKAIVPLLVMTGLICVVTAKKKKRG